MISVMNSINEAFTLLPSKMDSKEARLMLLAIGLQESRFRHRRQLAGNPPRPTGPAKSFWQGEKGGGMVHGVRTHSGVDEVLIDSPRYHAQRGAGMISYLAFGTFLMQSKCQSSLNFLISFSCRVFDS